MIDVTPDQFIRDVFYEAAPDETICVSKGFIPKGEPDNMAFMNMATTADEWIGWNPERQPRAWYFSVCTTNGETNDKGRLRRGRAQLVRYHVFVLDDIGQKTGAPPVEPSYKIETSPGSFQWGYCLEPGDDLKRYEALHKAVTRLGYGDQGAGGDYRVVRVPGSANLKPGRDLFRSRVTFWEPDVIWTLDELAQDFGLDLDDLPIVETAGTAMLAGGAEVAENIDPLLEWLADAGLVVKDDGGAFVDVVCPWSDSHTSGSNTAGYAPLGRGGENFVQGRGFKCQHEHCAGRRFGDFMKAMEAKGAPFVSSYDPLPWMLDKYVLVRQGEAFVDLHALEKGAKSYLFTASEMRTMTTGRNFSQIQPDGKVKQIPIATALLGSEDLRKVDLLAYRPNGRGERIVGNDAGQKVLNTYVKPNWEPTSARPEIFLEHIDYLIPDEMERETFLDWLAYKFQHPDRRSYCVVMVAENVQGTGRSTIKDYIAAALKGGVNSTTLAHLTGMSKDTQFNDWQAECQFVVVEEARDSEISGKDIYSAYETFKQNIDTKVLHDVRINPKYGRTRWDNIYYNAMIFSNHADALQLPEGDRRVFVVTNPETPRDADAYEKLARGVEGGEPRRLYHWLMARDVSQFDSIRPPMTPGKQYMVFASTPPSEDYLQEARARLGCSIITKHQLREVIVQLAIEEDDDNVIHKPQQRVNQIWKDLKSLKPDDRNGARIMVAGRQVEVRALRDRSKWLTHNSSGHGKKKEKLISENARFSLNDITTPPDNLLRLVKNGADDDEIS